MCEIGSVKRDAISDAKRRLENIDRLINDLQHERKHHERVLACLDPSKQQPKPVDEFACDICGGQLYDVRDHGIGTCVPDDRQAAAVRSAYPEHPTYPQRQADDTGPAGRGAGGGGDTTAASLHRLIRQIVEEALAARQRTG